MRFLLHDVHDITAHYEKLDSGTPADRETVEMIVDATAALCTNELAPLNAAADREGCTRIDANTVRTPSGYKEAYDLLRAERLAGVARELLESRARPRC